jgi:cysteinyl-tRNA synthetase
MPSKTPKASENVNGIIDFVRELIEKGYGYVTTEGNVYFSVAKKADYGKLSHRGLTEILTGTRIEPAKDKRSPADFALWKAAPIGVTEMTWDSPWGRGFPGWHIECSVMSRKFLGDTFDIHGSSIDNIFPHHENEIAQSESLTGKPMANYWVHSGLLTVNGQKMSKSLHNSVLVQDALKKYTTNEIRLAFFQTHYRKPFDYKNESMAQGVALRQKLFLAYESLPEQTDPKVWDEIISALNNDLDTPRALQVWAEHMDKINKSDTEKLFDVYGLDYHPIADNKQARELAEQRDMARTNRDFLTADNRKNELAQIGYEVLDTANGSRYVPR